MLMFLRQLVILKAVFLFSAFCLHASVIDKVTQIEQVIQKDPGNRGVSNFYTKDLLNAAETLQKKQRIAILTGFFIPSAQKPETDGPLGAVFLAQSLVGLGKQVSIVTDKHCLSSVMACVDLVRDKISSSQLNVLVFPEEKSLQSFFVSSLCEQIDCLLSIERVGRTFDGTYRSMRAIDITNKTAPLDDLFIYAQENPQLSIARISIGDGGNEIGMGNLVESVKKYIPRGEQIACVIPSDHLIVTGVSNWGGYALAGALWCLTNVDGQTNISIEQVYPLIEEQFKMLENMVLSDCCDGVLGKPALSVDGMPWNVHRKVLEDIFLIIR